MELFLGKHSDDKSLTKHLSEGILAWIVKADGRIVYIYRIALISDESTTHGYSFLKIVINLSTDCIPGTLGGHRDIYSVAVTLRFQFMKSGATISKLSLNIDEYLLWE